MKKLIIALFALVLAFSLTASADAPMIDWGSMTDEEITFLITQANAVLASRGVAVEEPAEESVEEDTDEATGENAEEITGEVPDEMPFLLFDEQGVKCTVSGKYNVWGFPEDGSFYLDLELIIENDSSLDAMIYIDACSVNGWEVFTMGGPDARAGKKQKGEVTINLADADIFDVNEIEEIELVVRMSDGDYNQLWISDPILLPLSFLK